MSKDNRPYLVDRRCATCLTPLVTTERHGDGWLYVTYACGKCGFRQVVIFSPQDLAEWSCRAWPKSRVTGASWS